jgi:proteasome lid subunit RPN8/RPN11
VEPTEDRPPVVLIEGSALRSVLSAHASATGAEPCGVLLGRAAPRAIRIEEAVSTGNAHPRPETAFLLAPAEVLRIGRDARERGLSIVGAWHGHPSGSADVSTADARGLSAGADAPGTPAGPSRAPFVFLISGRGAGRAPVVRAFGPGPGGPLELPLRGFPPPAPPARAAAAAASNARAPKAPANPKAPPTPDAPAAKKRAVRKRPAPTD